MLFRSVIGVLLAPEKGSETRSKLKNLARDLENFIKNSLDHKDVDYNASSESSSEKDD